MKKIAVLGGSGAIGKRTVDILKKEYLVYNVPYRVDKFKSSFPEIRQVKVPIPSEMDR